MNNQTLEEQDNRECCLCLDKLTDDTFFPCAHTERTLKISPMCRSEGYCKKNILDKLPKDQEQMEVLQQEMEVLQQEMEALQQEMEVHRTRYQTLETYKVIPEFIAPMVEDVEDLRQKLKKLLLRECPIFAIVGGDMSGKSFLAEIIEKITKARRCGAESLVLACGVYTSRADEYISRIYFGFCDSDFLMIDNTRARSVFPFRVYLEGDRDLEGNFTGKFEYHKQYEEKLQFFEAKAHTSIFICDADKTDQLPPETVVIHLPYMFVRRPGEPNERQDKNTCQFLEKKHFLSFLEEWILQ